LTLSNGTFCAVYAVAAGAMKFVIFDASLTVIASPATLAEAEYNSTNVVYHGATALAAGGFAVAYQTTARTAVRLTTFHNDGTLNLAATSVQTLSGTAAQAAVKIGQLPKGNLLIVMRSSMTPVGTSFIIVTIGGVSVVANTVADSVGTLGFIELSIIKSIAYAGTFCISSANGTNIVASVYSTAGAIQGAQYFTTNTVNFLTHNCSSITNDGMNFWLCYIPSATANGINVAWIPPTGTNYIDINFWAALTGTGTNSIACCITNGVLAVMVCSTLTAGQK